MLDFIGIGAQKAGTSWLYHHLSRHPAISFPAGKEVHFWDAHRDRGEAWWYSLFSDPDPEIKQGEITPAYAMLPVEDIQRIHAGAPKVRLLYSIRNPIDRIWAQTRFSAARRGIRVDECSDEWLIELFDSPGWVSRSAHLANLNRWRSVFPASQMLVVFFDDIVANPREVLTAVATHLGVAPEIFRDAGQNLQEKVLAGPSDQIPSHLKARLRDRYANDIRDLEVEFGRDLSNWLQ